MKAGLGYMPGFLRQTHQSAMEGERKQAKQAISRETKLSHVSENLWKPLMTGRNETAS